MSSEAEEELVFVAAVSSFTKEGFLASASFGGESVDLEFDDKDQGAFLTPEMCRKLRVKKGSRLLIVVEAEDEPVATEIAVAGSVSKPRISSARVYYEVGKEGGAILKLRKA